MVQALLRQNKAWIDQHGAEGPDALQVVIKARMVLPDLEGCSPLQPRNPVKAQHWPSPDRDTEGTKNRNEFLFGGGLMASFVCRNW